MTTTTFSPSFTQLKMSETDISRLRKDFELLLSEVDLSRPEKVERIITDYKQVPGIYFWVMRYGNEGDLFPIYVGKTNSLSYRVQNYVSEFQPHSPNDFKLRVFHAFLSDEMPTAVLDLRFSRQPVDQLAQSEKEAIDSYAPLLNRKRQASASTRLALQNAFAQYYRSAFEGLLLKMPPN